MIYDFCFFQSGGKSPCECHSTDIYYLREIVRLTKGARRDSQPCAESVSYMSRVFIPNIYVTISTEGIYHPKDSLYKISLGQENNSFVFKVQLVVNAKIRPRLTVSYDYNSRQFEKVMSAYKFLSETYNLIPKDLVEGLVTDRDLTAEFEKWEKKRDTKSLH